MKNDDMPRERFERQGPESLSNAELLALVVKTGTPGMGVLELCNNIMNDCHNNISELQERSLQELRETYKGIGTAKAIEIKAVAELAYRRSREKLDCRTHIKDSSDIYDLLSFMRTLDHEEAYAIYVNNANIVLRTRPIGKGGYTTSPVDIRQVLKEALLCNAIGIILAHNHPSGNTRPSRDDDELTQRLNNACSTMALHFIDHVIISSYGYYSYRDEGRM